MGRFSPTVPPGLSGLAQALLGGVKGYQGQVDRDRTEEDRQLGRSIKMSTEADRQRASDTDFVMKGGTPSLSQALEANPQAMQAPQFVPNAPNDFDRTTKDFRKSAISPMDEVAVRGGAVDRSFGIKQKMAETAGVGGVQMGLRADERGLLQGERREALQKFGMPEPVVGGASQSQAATDSYLREDEIQEPLVPVQNPDGTVVYYRRSQAAGMPVGKVATPESPRASAQVQKDYKDIEFGMNGIDRAIGLIEGNPTAFGLKNILGPTIVDRLDPQGIQARSAVENIVATIRHSLYGAALTRPEIQRALTNLPDVKNDPDGAIVRLRELQVMLQQEMSAIDVSREKTSGIQAPAQTPAPARSAQELKRQFMAPPEDDE